MAKCINIVKRSLLNEKREKKRRKRQTRRGEEKRVMRCSHWHIDIVLKLKLSRHGSHYMFDIAAGILGIIDEEII